MQAVTKMRPSNQGNHTKINKRDELMKRLQHELNLDVIYELRNLLHGNKLKAVEKARIYTELMRYMYPQLKAIEYNENAGEVIRVSFVVPEDAKDLAKELERVGKVEETVEQEFAEAA